MSDQPKNLLAQYKAARTALEKMNRIDPVAKIHNKAIAMEVHGYKARDKALVVYATNIKSRAVRRLGVLMEEKQRCDQKPDRARG